MLFVCSSVYIPRNTGPSAGGRTRLRFVACYCYRVCLSIHGRTEIREQLTKRLDEKLKCTMIKFICLYLVWVYILVGLYMSGNPQRLTSRVATIYNQAYNYHKQNMGLHACFCTLLPTRGNEKRKQGTTLWKNVY